MVTRTKNIRLIFIVLLVVGVLMLAVGGFILSRYSSSEPAVTLPTAEEAPPAPAAFQTANLAINPAEVNPGRELSITATVTNTGDVKGSYMAELKINGNTRETTQVIVDAGETKAVTFAVVKDTPGIYEVVLGGLNGQFEVLKQATPPQSFNPTIGDSTTPSRRKPSRPRCCG
jgi:hypothetical protein